MLLQFVHSLPLPWHCYHSLLLWHDYHHLLYQPHIVSQLLCLLLTRQNVFTPTEEIDSMLWPRVYCTQLSIFSLEREKNAHSSLLFDMGTHSSCEGVESPLFSLVFETLFHRWSLLKESVALGSPSPSTSSFKHSGISVTSFSSWEGSVGSYAQESIYWGHVMQVVRRAASQREAGHSGHTQERALSSSHARKGAKELHRHVQWTVGAALCCSAPIVQLRQPPWVQRSTSCEASRCNSSMPGHHAI